MRERNKMSTMKKGETEELRERKMDGEREREKYKLQKERK